jgi:hypothetical protein
MSLFGKLYSSSIAAQFLTTCVPISSTVGSTSGPFQDHRPWRYENLPKELQAAFENMTHEQIQEMAKIAKVIRELHPEGQNGMAQGAAQQQALRNP